MRNQALMMASCGHFHCFMPVAVFLLASAGRVLENDGNMPCVFIFIGGLVGRLLCPLVVDRSRHGATQGKMNATRLR